MPCKTEEGQRRLDSYNEWKETGTITCSMCRKVWRIHSVESYRTRFLVHTCYDYDAVMKQIESDKGIE